MTISPTNEQGGPRTGTAPMLNQSHPQDATNAADSKPIGLQTNPTDCLQALISVFADAEAKKPCDEMTVGEFIAEILDAKKEHVSEVLKIREAVENFADKDDIINPLKKGLPAVSLSGLVTNGGRAKAFEEARFQHSGWLQIDLDGKDFYPRTPEDVRDQVGSDPHVAAAFLSPTGTGVKALLRIPVCQNAAEHRAAFNAAEAYFLATYALEIDTSTKDPVRMFFVSHDPDAKLNPSPAPLPVPEPQARPRLAATQEAAQPLARPKVNTEAMKCRLVLHGHPERDAWNLSDLAEMLQLIPRPGYDEWLRIASGAWQEFGEAATPILAARWPEETAGEYAEKFAHRLTDVSFGTVVHHAKEHGWKPEPRQQAITKDKREAVSNGKAPSPDVFRAMLAERAFDAANVPQRPIPILMLGDKVISTPGNLMNIQAPAKAGKSAVIGAIIAAMFNGNRQGADTLGFSADNTEGRAVLHFDTEQSRFDHDGLIRRAMTRARVENTPPWFHSYCLTDLATLNRQAAIETAVEDAAAKHSGVFAIILDGVADICRDPNNPEEAFALVDGLHAAAIKHDCAIITVLHENPGSETGKMRGHLGSQLERKAETPLRLAKDPGNGITTIWTDRARHCHIPKEKGTCFSWCDTMGMHVSRGSAGEIKASEKQAKFREEAEAAFGDTASLSYSAFVAAIMLATGLKSEKTAQKRVTTYQAEGIVLKNLGGSYSLKT